MFEFYVLNYNHNSKKVEMFNIFNNWVLDEAVQKEVKKYLRSSGKYKYTEYNYKTKENNYIFGFEGFKQEILSLIKWQESCRCEYEIGVTEPFTQDLNTIEKWDCYMQCKPNIEIICHEIIRQYKTAMKNKENYYETN